jgi:hypothetical protein
MEARAGRTRKRRFAMSRKMMRVVVTLLVLVTFTAGAAPAAPWSIADDLEGAPLAALWERIVSWFQTPEPTAVWTEGSSMDPDGVTTGDEGSQMDPNG